MIDELVDELVDVLYRPRIKNKYGITEADIRELIVLNIYIDSNRTGYMVIKTPPDKCQFCGGAKKTGKTTFTEDLGFGTETSYTSPKTSEVLKTSSVTVILIHF